MVYYRPQSHPVCFRFVAIVRACFDTRRTLV